MQIFIHQVPQLCAARWNTKHWKNATNTRQNMLNAPQAEHCPLFGNVANKLKNWILASINSKSDRLFPLFFFILLSSVLMCMSIGIFIVLCHLFYVVYVLTVLATCTICIVFLLFWNPPKPLCRDTITNAFVFASKIVIVLLHKIVRAQW